MIWLQEILQNNHKAAGAVSNMQQSLAKTMEVLSSPNTSCIVTSRLSGKPVTQVIMIEILSSPNTSCIETSVLYVLHNHIAVRGA